MLTVEEDAALMSYLMYMAEQEFPLTQTVTMAFAWAISKHSGIAILKQGQASTCGVIFVSDILDLLCVEVTNLIIAEWNA